MKTTFYVSAMCHSYKGTAHIGKILYVSANGFNSLILTLNPQSSFKQYFYQFVN